jgi:hypothetical protein
MVKHDELQKCQKKAQSPENEKPFKTQNKMSRKIRVRPLSGVTDPYNRSLYIGRFVPTNLQLIGERQTALHLRDTKHFSLPISPRPQAATPLTFLPVMETFSLQRQEGAKRGLCQSKEGGFMKA